MLWRDQVVGWGNLQVHDRRLIAELGYVDARPRTQAFTAALEDELGRMSVFLRL